MLKTRFSDKILECGVDEAGRGPLAGPVVAAAVILPLDFYHPLLNDSKVMKEKDRYLLKQIIEKEAISFAIAEVSVETIDKINILQASFLAMHQAIQKLEKTPEFLIIDGNRFTTFEKIPHACIVKGDSKYSSIAAASVLAKTYRDDVMEMLAKEFPQYGWEKNKGYPTKQHREAIQNYGITIWHRKSYQLLPTKTLFD